MSIEALVKAAVSPQQAMTIIAHALDLLLEGQANQQPQIDPWGAWGDEPVSDHTEWNSYPSAMKRVVQQAPFTEVPMGDEQAPSSDVILPVPDKEQYDRRYKFAKWQLHLDEYYEVEGKPENMDSWAEAYAKGGPYWLYVADRDAVMSYPYYYRQMMVEDIERDDPEKAQEVARDILKVDADETGPDKSIPMAVAEVDGKHK